jgi:hypothetical protein
MCFIVSINHICKKKNEVARVYLINKRFKLFSVRIESSEPASEVPCPASVTVASGKKSAVIYLFAQLIKKGYLISIDGKKVPRDKAIEELMSKSFDIEVENVRQLLKKYKDRRDFEKLIRDLANEPILECGG